MLITLGSRYQYIEVARPGTFKILEKIVGFFVFQKHVCSSLVVIDYCT